MTRITLFTRWFTHLVRWGLALVFLVSGVLKLGDLSAFAASVGDYGLVWDRWTWPIAAMLAAVEVIAGVLLAAGIRGGLALVTGLLCLFVGVLGYGIWLGLDIECGCLGPDLSHSLRGALVVDLALLAACGYLACFGRTAKPGHLDRTGGRATVQE